MLFADFSLSDALLNRLTELGYQQPTPIQQQAIPLILQGHDLQATAQTGTGKTAAFGVPLLQQLLCRPNEAQCRALVLVPTRELAQQVGQNLQQYAALTSLKILSLYGGIDSQQQQRQLAAGCDLIVATPGRLLDHCRQGHLRLNQVQYLVLDEADRMLDMGFADELFAILKKLPKERQTLLFSATQDQRMRSFSQRLLVSPRVIQTAPHNSTVSHITERVYNIDKEQKVAALCHLLRQHQWPQALIFSRKREEADQLVAQLKQAQFNAAALHAELSQSVREQVLTQFSQGQLALLVATDVAARGLDIDSLSAVINMELPFRSEDYVHRIGRTGRAGQSGLAISFLSVDDEPLLIKLESLLERRLPQQWLPGFEPDLSRVAPATRKTRRGALKQQARKQALQRGRH
ncbi:MAG: DEAD/DEAH box helicase [Ferrimonas sp.]